MTLAVVAIPPPSFKRQIMRLYIRALSSDSADNDKYDNNMANGSHIINNTYIR